MSEKYFFSMKMLTQILFDGCFSQTWLGDYTISSYVKFSWFPIDLIQLLQNSAFTAVIISLASASRLTGIDLSRPIA